MNIDIYNDGKYLTNNPAWHGADNIWKANHVLDLFRRNHVVPRSVVEVGCGAGGIIAEVARQIPDARAVGYDISSDAARLWPSARPTNLNYHVADFTESKERYDVLLLIDVFEHVEDYIGFLRILRGRANHFVFHVPLDMSIVGLLRRNYMKGRKEVGHLHYFTHESALATLATAGFEARDWFFTAMSIEASAELRTWRTNFLNIFRRALAGVNPAAAATWFGGYSMMILASPAKD